MKKMPLPDPDPFRNRIWNGMMDAERISRYYMAVSVKMNRMQFFFSIFIVSSSILLSGGLITDSLARPWLALVSIGLLIATVWSSYCDYSKRASIASVIADKCRDVALEWKNLWVKYELPDVMVSLEQIEYLDKRMDAITSSIHIPSLGLSERTNKKCAEEAYAVINQEFSPQQDA